MALIDGHERLTVGELLIELEDSDPNMVVVVTGHIDGKYVSRSVYKTADAADETELFIYMDPDEWPERLENIR